MAYDCKRWPRKKPNFTGKPNAELRDYLHRRQYTIYQLAVWVGVTNATMQRWLNKPLTDERRQRIEAALEVMAKQREGY